MLYQVPEILRDRPPSRRCIRVAVLMMQKNEEALLQRWLEYHSFLFGPDNLYVWDNGSTSEKCLEILRRFEGLGVTVNYDMNTGDDFRRKGVILGNKIKELESCEGYEFFFPLDCDEFLAVEKDPGDVRCDSYSIACELASLIGEQRALGVQWAYNNVLGQDDYFWRTPHTKTFFYSGTFKVMDHGYHEGRSRMVEGRRDTRFVYIHYHHKPYAIIVEHSREKLRPFMNIDDPEVLKAEYEKRNRLARFIVDSEEEYMKKFTVDKAVYVPRIRSFFYALGSNSPFQHIMS